MGDAQRQPLPEGHLWIDGAWQESGTWADGLDPCTGKVAYRYVVAESVDVERAVAAARRAQPAWAALPERDRRAVLRRTLHLVADRIDRIAAVIRRETGKPPGECVGGGELPVALEVLAYYAGRTEGVLRPRRIRLPLRPYFFGKGGMVRRVPLGVVGAITPWNVPFSLAASAVVPALAAGNAVVVKPSEFAPLSVLELARAFADAGLPAGVLNVICGGPETGRALVDAEVDRIIFIGSAGTGRAIARALAERGRRPPVLELGGKDAMIVAADADVAYAAQGAVWGAFSQAGQVCSAVERVYVARSVAPAFIDRVLETTAILAARAGFREQDGMLLSPVASETFGPLISAAARERVHSRVTEAAAGGARVRAGGRIPQGPGFWYPPTVITDTSDGMTIMQEETFGPVLPIAVVADEEEAVTRANASRYGLTASVWTKDLARGRRLGARLQVGMAMVNDHSSVYAMIDSPWGGRGGSGFGRLHGPEALLELTEPAALVTDRVPTPKIWWYPYTPEALVYFRRGNEFLFAGSVRRRLAALVPTIRALLAGRRRPGLGR